MKTCFLFFNLMLTIFVFSQETKRSLFIQAKNDDPREPYVSYFLTADAYKLFSNEISFDTTLIEKYNKNYRVWYLENGNVKSFYPFTSSAGLKLGSASDSLKKIEFDSQLLSNLTYTEASFISDSLARINAWYMVTPSLMTINHYEFQFEAYFINPLDTTNMSIEVADSIFFVKYVKPTYANLKITYPHLDSTQLLATGLKYDKMWIQIFSPTYEFDFDKLSDLGLKIIELPEIEPLKYRFTIFYGYKE